MDRLALDVMLGKLARYLRMCGYDAAYALDAGVETDGELLELVRKEQRLLLTRDVQLAGRAERSLLLKSLDVRDQLRELRTAGFELTLTEPTRCALCNARLERLPDGASTPAYAPTTAETPVWRCPSCGQHYWRGSHWDDVAATLADL